MVPVVQIEQKGRNMSNLPPGVQPGDIPGNRPEDKEWDKFHDQINKDVDTHAFGPKEAQRVWALGLAEWLDER